MPFTLPDLPYAIDALEPHMSAETLRYHHGKHHATYIDKLNGLIEGTDLAGKTLEQIVVDSAGHADRKAIFNNAAQAWNHIVFWDCMMPNGGGTPTGDLADAISGAFGSYEQFRSDFLETAIGQFGSGWAWLVVDNGALRVIATPNAMNPIVQGHHVLMGCDVWEHAYYIDYRNRRPDYAAAFLDRLMNWDYVAGRLEATDRQSTAA